MVLKQISLIRLLAVVVATIPLLAVGRELPSGLKPGDFAVPFRCLDVTGPDKGSVLCLVCKHGSRPLAVVFARRLSDPLRDLLKQLDAAVDRHQESQLAGFAAFLTDDPERTEALLQRFAQKENLSSNMPLVIPEASTGPPHYKIAKDAEVTVILFREGEVVHNHRFASKELSDAGVQRVLRSLTEILPNHHSTP